MQDPKLTLADQEVIQPNPLGLSDEEMKTILSGSPDGKAMVMARLKSMVAGTFINSENHSKSYQPKNLLGVDGQAKLSAAEAKRLKRQQRNIQNASV